jgi:hypothetical protein
MTDVLSTPQRSVDAGLVLDPLACERLRTGCGAARENASRLARKGGESHAVELVNALGDVILE